MSDQYVDRRPPGCRLRLEVGSGEARWRQPTCWNGAGYNLAPTPGGTTGKSPVSSGRPPELTAFSAYGRIISVSPLHSRQISCIITI